MNPSGSLGPRGGASQHGLTQFSSPVVDLTVDEEMEVLTQPSKRRRITENEWEEALAGTPLQDDRSWLRNTLTASPVAGSVLIRGAHAYSSPRRGFQSGAQSAASVEAGPSGSNHGRFQPRAGDMTGNQELAEIPPLGDGSRPGNMLTPSLAGRQPALLGGSRSRMHPPRQDGTQTAATFLFGTGAGGAPPGSTQATPVDLTSDDNSGAPSDRLRRYVARTRAKDLQSPQSVPPQVVPPGFSTKRQQHRVRGLFTYGWMGRNESREHLKKLRDACFEELGIGPKLEHVRTLPLNDVKVQTIVHTRYLQGYRRASKHKGQRPSGTSAYAQDFAKIFPPMVAFKQALEEHTSSQHDPESLVLWSDGSHAHSESALAVVYRYALPGGSAWGPWKAYGFKSKGQLPAGQRAGSGEMEAIGVIKALDIASTKVTKHPRRFKQVRIYTDAQSVLNLAQNPRSNSLGKRIVDKVKALRALGPKVEMFWSPGHKGVPGNELADRVATYAGRHTYTNDKEYIDLTDDEEEAEPPASNDHEMESLWRRIDRNVAEIDRMVGESQEEGQINERERNNLSEWEDDWFSEDEPSGPNMQEEPEVSEWENDWISEDESELPGSMRGTARPRMTEDEATTAATHHGAMSQELEGIVQEDVSEDEFELPDSMRETDMPLLAEEGAITRESRQRATSPDMEANTGDILLGLLNKLEEQDKAMEAERHREMES